MNMTKEDQLTALADLETIWSVIDSFYKNLSPQDLSRKHGKEWTFADLPYHLAYFNQSIIEGIRDSHGQQAKRNIEELNAWNNAYFAQRPASQTGVKGLDYLHATQMSIRETAARLAPETPVFLPMMLVGGWRTITFALEYLFQHAWFHFTETHLRFNNQLPDLPAGPVNRVLNFSMEVLAGCLRPEDLTNVDLVNTIHLTGAGGGTWTLKLQHGKCLVEVGPVAHADTEMTTDIATFMKTSYYGLENPLLALLLGKLRIKGLAKSRQFQKIFAPTPSRVWNLVEFGKSSAS